MPNVLSIEPRQFSFSMRFAIIGVMVMVLGGVGYWGLIQKKIADKNTQQLAQQINEKNAQKEMQVHPAEVNSQHVSPSFDCAKARSTVENLICNDSELSILDSELSKIFQHAKVKATDQNEFKKQNVAEWKWREANCQSKECLTEWYARRKMQLLQIAN